MYFSLNSARIFFRADKTADEEKEEKESKESSSEGKKIMTLNEGVCNKNRSYAVFSCYGNFF